LIVPLNYVSQPFYVLVVKSSTEVLRVFENKIQRRITRPKSEVVVGGWRRLQNAAS
jgi:hypothetical protein